MTTEGLVDIHGDPLPPGAVMRLGRLWMDYYFLKGKVIAARSPDQRFVASFDRAVAHVWDVESGKKHLDIDLWSAWDVDDGRFGIEFSPDSRSLLLTPTEDRFELWHLYEKRALCSGCIDCDNLFHYDDNLTFSPTGSVLVGTDFTEALCLWDTADGRVVYRPHAPRCVNWFHFAPDGSKALVSTEVREGLDGEEEITDPALTVLSLPAGHVLLELPGETDGDFSANGNQLRIQRSDGRIDSWELPRNTPGEEAQAASGGSRERAEPLDAGSSPDMVEWHTEEVFSVAVSPDGRQVASGSEDNTVRLWSLETGRQLAAFNWHSETVKAVAFSPDGRFLASGGHDNALKLWDTSTKELRPPLPCDDGIEAVAFSSEGDLVAAGTANGAIIIWDTGTGDRQARIDPPKLEQGPITSLVFSPDKKLLLAGRWEGRIWCLDREKGLASVPLPLRKPEELHAADIALSPSGKLLAVAWNPTREARVPEDAVNSVKVYDMSDWAVFHHVRCHMEQVHSVSFSPCGSFLAISGASRASWKNLSVHNLFTGKSVEIGNFEAYSVRYAPGGKRLLSCGPDMTVLVWDAAPLHEKIGLAAEDKVVVTRVMNMDDGTLARQLMQRHPQIARTSGEIDESVFAELLRREDPAFYKQTLRDDQTAGKDR